MHELFPLSYLRDRIGKPLHCDQYGLPQYREIVQLKCDSVTGLAFNVWNRIVHDPKHSANPMALKPYISFPRGMNSRPEIDPKIVEGIESETGEEVVRDISYSRCVILDEPTIDSEPIAELMVAHVYPNDLHIADVHFRNPYKPIPAVERKHHYRKFRGFGLLGKVMADIESYAIRHGFDYLTLTAAHDDLLPLFASYGFVIESNEMGKMARAMEKRCN